ncbi:CapA family protein [Chloroflexota bacterium]
MSDKDNTVKLIAVGDVGGAPEGFFNLTGPIIKEADIAFAQLEGKLAGKGTPQLYPTGRTRSFAPDPQRAKTLLDAGFNIMSLASNHTLDSSEGPLLETIDVLRQNNIAAIGVGKNIEEARKPAIFECKGTKVGFLAYCSVTPPGYEAREDKSGLAPVRAITAYQQVDWQPGTPPRIISQANPDDLAAMVEDIKKLRPKVDVLVVSMHWGVHFAPAIIAEYQYEAGHAAIDVGADIIIGHHAHILKGIEVYKGKVIFFSLCNFCLPLPLSFMNDPHTDLHHIHEFYRYPVDPEYTNYAFPIDSQKTILVKCNIADKKIQRVAYLPLWVNKKGEPEPLSRSDTRSDEHLRYMEWVCKDQLLDTKFSREGDEVVVLT